MLKSDKIFDIIWLDESDAHYCRDTLTRTGADGVCARRKGVAAWHRHSHRADVIAVSLYSHELVPGDDSDIFHRDWTLMCANGEGDEQEDSERGFLSSPWNLPCCILLDRWGWHGPSVTSIALRLDSRVPATKSWSGADTMFLPSVYINGTRQGRRCVAACGVRHRTRGIRSSCSCPPRIRTCTRQFRHRREEWIPGTTSPVSHSWSECDGVEFWAHRLRGPDIRHGIAFKGSIDFTVAYAAGPGTGRNRGRLLARRCGGRSTRSKAPPSIRGSVAAAVSVGVDTPIGSPA